MVNKKKSRLPNHHRLKNDKMFVARLFKNLIYRIFKIVSILFRIDTRYLKCKEILHLDQNLSIYIQTQFTETISSTKSADTSRQYYIDPSRTRVTQQFCINARLPRNLASVPPFAFEVFSAMLKLAENNIAEDIRLRMRYIIFFLIDFDHFYNFF